MTIIETKLSHHKDDLEYIRGRIDAGCYFFQQGENGLADEAFSAALYRAQQVVKDNPKDPSYQVVLAETYHLMALGYMHWKDLKKARLHILKAFEALTRSRIDDPWYEVTLRSTLARIEQMSSHHRKALMILEEACSFCRDNGFKEIKEDGFLYSHNMIVMATGYMAVDDFARMSQTAEDVIALRHRYPEGYYNKNAEEYLAFLSMLEHEAEKYEDGAFRCVVLEEGIQYCEDAKAHGRKVNVTKEAELYQHLQQQHFLDHDIEALRRTYQAQLKLCNDNTGEPMDCIKVITHLNYAVYCSILEESEMAKQAIEDALAECMNLKDDGGPEHTMFIVSALSTLSNLEWDGGDYVSALRYIDSEITILSHFGESHPDQLSKILPMLLDAMYNQTTLRYELGKSEMAEQDIKAIKRRHQINPENANRCEIASAITVLKRCADMHQILQNHQQALEEYQEVLYLIGSLHEEGKEAKEMLEDIEKEVQMAIEAEKTALKSE